MAQSGLFDDDFYRDSHALPAWGQEAPALHYLLVGGPRGYDPHPLFFGEHYLAAQPDARAWRAPLLHFLLYGRRYGASGLAMFDAAAYRLANSGRELAARRPYEDLLRRPWREELDKPLLQVPLLHRWSRGHGVPSQAKALDRTLADASGDHAALEARALGDGEAIVRQMAATLPGPAALLGAWLTRAPEVLESTWPVATAKANARAEGAPRNRVVALLEAELERFLAGDQRLRFPAVERPRVTVLLVLFNQAALTLGCLRALLAQADPPPYELVVVDNASSDQTAALLDRLDGVTVLRQSRNLHYLAGVNSALESLHGEQLLLLNNDAFIAPDALRRASDLLRLDQSIGAVGGRLLFADGRLQEAGNFLLQDGCTKGYGHGWPGNVPQVLFQRDVDYVSGALLLVRGEFFRQRGGFSSAYRGAYFEDVDLCEAIWRSGQRVVYDPRVVALHLESASSPDMTDAIKLMQANQAVFVRKYPDRLAASLPAKDPGVWRLRHRGGTSRRRVLFLDDRIPLARYGSGFPRARAMLEALVRQGNAVTLVPASYHGERWEEVWEELPAGVELLPHLPGTQVWSRLIEALREDDAVIISRPHNLALHCPVLRLARERGWPARVIFDAEAIYARREILQATVQGRPLPPREARRRVWVEGQLAQNADVVLTVSEQEARDLRRCGGRPTLVLPHSILPAPGAAGFAERRGLLFVGATHELDTPNGDALRWLAERIWPRMAAWLAPQGLSVVGQLPPSLRALLERQGLQCLGSQASLAPIYDSARIFVAPTRFAAGVPLKILEAAAAGLPVVASRLLGEQLGWRDGREILLADVEDPAAFAAACQRLYKDSALWNRLRAGALERLRQDCDPAHCAAILEQAMTLPLKG